MIKRLLKDESGQGMAEYGLIIALAAVAVIGALTFLGVVLSNKFEFIGNIIDKAESKKGL
jgi:pilus assembly protein Flp/PilA